MPRYRVSFEGKWQAEFDNVGEALTYANEVGETGRLTHVVRDGFWPKLVAVFPEHMTEVGKKLWGRRAAGAGGGG